MDTAESKIKISSGKITIWIKKVKKGDNWFSLYKQKTVGGDDSDWIL